MGGGFAGYGIAKTHIRRLQRKPSEASYRQMKEKLSLIVRPMPTNAISAAANLEDFRHPLRCKEDHITAPAVETLPPNGNQCTWCGIWMPLHSQRIDIIAASTNTDEPLVQQLKAVDKAVDALLEECLGLAPRRTQLADH